MCLCVFAGDIVTYVKEQFVLQVLEGGIVLNKNNEVCKFYL